MDQPLVSCLMPTMPGREHMAKLAIRDFQRQTYKNKELIVACSGDSSTMTELFGYIQGLGDPTIHCPFLTTEDKKPVILGAMRNFTNEIGTGEWMCTWDDDDRHHPDRILLHMHAANREQADITYLNMQLHCFPDINQLWWVDWQSHRSPGYVCYRRTDIKYQEDASLGEDTLFLRNLAAAGYKFAKVETDIPIYIRYYHGANAWHRRHHETLVQGHTTYWQRIADYRDKLTGFLRLMEIPGPLDLVCRQGIVFKYMGVHR